MPRYIVSSTLTTSKLKEVLLALVSSVSIANANEKSNLVNTRDYIDSNTIKALGEII